MPLPDPAVHPIVVRLGAAPALFAAAVVLTLAPPASAQQKLHFTYLWHLEQPIYWPDRQATGADRYERAWESLQRRDAGAAHPSNNLRDVFGLADRVAAYQSRTRDSINAMRTIGGASEAGAQISYSGGLIENIQSLSAANQLGYTSNWNTFLREARGWTTTSGAARPRADIVLFSHHHALLPLIEPSTIRKELQVYKEAYADAWGTTIPRSRGFFPSEMAFSTRMIPALQAEGVEWAFVSAEKISRACTTFPTVFGSGGTNTDAPNRADQLNVTTDPFYRVSISRGCAPAEAYPYALTPRRARYVDPDTGTVSSLIAVPCSQSLGWKDGYAPIGLSDFDALNQRNDPARPMLIVLAHDGDNAWGGGYSYYLEATPNLVSQALGAGYVPSTVERYLNDHPVPGADFAHVEDGAWVNADGDFGSPQFINWNWPPVLANGTIDIPSGWGEDIRNWAIITAAQNRVDTAEQVWLAQGGSVTPRKILSPDAATNPVERAWHYFLGALNSGYMYYGTAEDFEVKPTIACNEAARLADPVIAAAPASGPASDQTGPTIWIPQRHPWNPGSTGFGPQYAYRQVQNNGDFWVWTFVDDAAGLPAGAVTLMYRLDTDGQRSLTGTENETYAGGPGVGPWQSITMTRRAFPAGNFFNDPSINFFELPLHIADQYHAQIIGVRSALVDYYVEATDTRGNLRRSPIQHVWVGDGSGAGGGGGTTLALTPASPIAGQPVSFTYDPAGRPLAGQATIRAHVGFNAWATVTPNLPMTLDTGTGRWTGSITLPTTTTQLDLAFNNGANLWDNNGGGDWHFAVQAAPPVSGACCTSGSCSVVLSTACTAPGATFAAAGVCTPNPCPLPPPLQWVMDGNLDPQATLIGTSGSLVLRAGLSGDILYLAASAPVNANDHFIFLGVPPATPGALAGAQWAKAGQVATTEAFIGAESTNGYIGWFNAGATSAAVQARGSVIEGAINLRSELGLAPTAPLPDRIAIAFGAYTTPDAGTLRPTLQIPPSVNNDANLDAAEFATVRLCDIRVGGCCRPDFDQNGLREPNDIFAFLNAYFSDPPTNLQTDFDASGTRQPADIFAFLNAYFAGC